MGGASSRHQISEGSTLNASLLRDPDWRVKCFRVRVCECISFHLVKTACDLLSPLHSTPNQGRSAAATRASGSTVGCRCGFSRWGMTMGQPISANSVITDVWRTGRAQTEASIILRFHKS